MPVKKDDFARAAIRKGFCEKRSGHHIYYRYETPGGRLSPYIHTHISHGGGKDISDALLSESGLTRRDGLSRARQMPCDQVFGGNLRLPKGRSLRGHPSSFIAPFLVNRIEFV